MKLKGQLTGAVDLKATLDAVAAKVLKAGAKKGVTASAQVLAKEMKAAVPADTKSLKKAIGHKAKVRRDGSGVYAVIGPRRDSKKDRKAGKVKFRRKVGIRKRAGGLPGVVKYADPVKYAHLVEFGRKAVSVKKKKLLSDGQQGFGPRVKAIEGRHPLGKTWVNNEARCAAIVRQKLAEAAKGIRGKR